MSNNFIAHRGFLPEQDPLLSLPNDYVAWESMGANLPKLLLSSKSRSELASMPVLNTEALQSSAELERAMVLLSFLGHAYVWGDAKPADKIPASIAKPWYEVSQRLKRPPVLSYASYALHNWRRFDLQQPIELGNIALLQNFLGGIDEEWFVLVHVDIEAKAVPALQAILSAQQAVEEKNSELLVQHLQTIAQALEKMCETLDRMPEHCDPYIYYNRVRPYIHGWKDNPALLQGVIYEDVATYHGQPQKFRGETGAQSGIVPVLDAALGIQHENDALRVYLMEMREYMPAAHRQFLQKIERCASIREFVLQYYQNDPKLKDAYNACIYLINRFRQTHLHYAAQYIQKQSQTSLANPTSVGTAGTPFMVYLRKHKEETLSHLIGTNI